MRWLFACGLGLLLIALGARRAEACGGVVSGERDLVVQAQQRVLISLLSDDTSKIVLQLSIPSADVPFGALTPVGVQPTLDPEPVDVAEIDALDRATRPVVEEEESGGGCSCVPTAGSDDSAAGGSKRGVTVTQVVDIGPVTAVVLTADSPAPLAEWLTSNGFVIPSADQSFVDAYVGPGKFFIAFKRSSQAQPGPSSVGITFSAAGDMRGYPLRMSRIGAANRLGIQVFVAAPARVAPNGSAPSAPFVALTLTDSDAVSTSGRLQRRRVRPGFGALVQGLRRRRRVQGQRELAEQPRSEAHAHHRAGSGADAAGQRGRARNARSRRDVRRPGAGQGPDADRREREPRRPRAPADICADRRGQRAAALPAGTLAAPSSLALGANLDSEFAAVFGVLGAYVHGPAADGAVFDVILRLAATWIRKDFQKLSAPGTGLHRGSLSAG